MAKRQQTITTARYEVKTAFGKGELMYAFELCFEYTKRTHGFSTVHAHSSVHKSCREEYALARIETVIPRQHRQAIHS